jgi:shikimate kinase
MRNIVLLGFMGTGKSAVGRRLARDLHYQFVDTDQLIEEKTGKRISELFEQEGEAHFRRLEAEVAQEVGRREQAVISTGGGIVLNPANLEALRRNGVLVSLQARPEVILKRVQKRAGQRPLLKGPDPLSEIHRLLQERELQYRGADFTLDTSDIDAEAAAQLLKQRVLEFEGRKSTS